MSNTAGVLYAEGTAYHSRAPGFAAQNWFLIGSV